MQIWSLAFNKTYVHTDVVLDIECFGNEYTELLHETIDLGPISTRYMS